MAASDAKISVSCDRCNAYRDVDIPALLAKVGPNYSLINRRCRCKLTPGCNGWNRFRYLHGVMRRLWDDNASDRWLALENASRREMTRLIREAGEEREKKRLRERR